MNDHIVCSVVKPLMEKQFLKILNFCKIADETIPRKKKEKKTISFDWIRKSYQATKVLFKGINIRAFSSFVVILATLMGFCNIIHTCPFSC